MRNNVIALVCPVLASLLFALCSPKKEIDSLEVILDNHVEMIVEFTPEDTLPNRADTLFKAQIRELYSYGYHKVVCKVLSKGKKLHAVTVMRIENNTIYICSIFIKPAEDGVSFGETFLYKVDIDKLYLPPSNQEFFMLNFDDSKMYEVAVLLAIGTDQGSFMYEGPYNPPTPYRNKTLRAL